MEGQFEWRSWVTQKLCYEVDGRPVWVHIVSLKWKRGNKATGIIQRWDLRSVVVTVITAHKENTKSSILNSVPLRTQLVPVLWSIWEWLKGFCSSLHASEKILIYQKVDVADVYTVYYCQIKIQSYSWVTVAINLLCLFRLKLDVTWMQDTLVLWTISKHSVISYLYCWK